MGLQNQKEGMSTQFLFLSYKTMHTVYHHLLICNIILNCNESCHDDNAYKAGVIIAAEL